MFKTDIHTVFLIVALNKFLLGFLLLHIRKLTGEAMGMRYWAYGSIITGIGLLITSFFDYPIPVGQEFLFSLFLNIFIFSGDIIFLFGIQRFKGKEINRKLWIIPVISALNITLFTLIDYNASVRLVVNGLLSVTLYVLSASEFLDRNYKSFKNLFRICAALFLLVALIHFLRSVAVVIQPTEEPVSDNTATYLLVGIAGVSYIILTYYLIIMVTNKLTSALTTQIESKNRLYKIISHDLQGPFGNLVNFIALLKHSYRNWDTQKIQKWISDVEGITSGSRFLLENLFNWSRSQLNEIKVERSVKDINEVIQLVLKYIGSIAESKNHQIIFNNTSPVIGFFDPDMMSIVIRNILTNSIKFTERGGEIQISAYERNNNIEIIITDNGIGIPEEKLINLLDNNQSQSTYGTESEKGSGFGLLLCKELVSLNNGNIYITSEISKGSAFRIVLPKPNQFYE